VIRADITRQVGVTHQIVSEWRKASREAGRDALRAAGRAGRKAKLSREELDQVQEALAKVPKPNGYPSDLWTVRRIAEVIERVTGVSYDLVMCGTSCATS
jgi:transposase